MAEVALYYPYIHVRDPNWLKGTLLLFEQVERMVPCRNVRGDLPEVAPFTQPHGGRRPLLDPTDLWSPRAKQAQRELARKLQDTVAADPEFAIRFGEAEAIRLKSNPYGFQIHQQKLHRDLQSALWDTNLGFKPGIEEPGNTGGEYVELHPQVGQAVMSTLAVACATAGNLDIVTDQGSERLHECLLQKKADAIFDAYLARRPTCPIHRPRTSMSYLRCY